jgi:choice-of-anchor C domain-containing protein
LNQYKINILSSMGSGKGYWINAGTSFSESFEGGIMKKNLFIAFFIFTAQILFANSTIEFNTDRMGMDYKSFDLPNADYRLCKQACEAESKCKAWTYVKPNTIQGPNPRCWLKYNIPASIHNDACISGIKKSKNLKTVIFKKPSIDNYRLDWCRVWGADCGKGAADAFCRLKGYEKAINWEEAFDIGASSPTKVISSGQICNQGFCDGFKFIECEKSIKQPVDVSNKYLGCYKDSGDPFGLNGRDLNGFMFQSKDMTPQKCISLCNQKGFKYAGVQYSNQCFCGNSYGKYGVATNCDMPCSGNRDKMCGGFWANSVYGITIKKIENHNIINKNNLIKNGSFEEGPLHVSPWTTLRRGSNKISNWVIKKGSIDLVGDYWKSSDGHRSIDLCGFDRGVISQNIHTIPRHRYKLTFDLSGNPDNNNLKYLKVMTAGGISKLFTFDTRGKNHKNMGWVKKSLIFTATSDITNISFIATNNNPSSCGPVLDNIKVVELSKIDNNRVLPVYKQTYYHDDFNFLNKKFWIPLEWQTLKYSLNKIYIKNGILDLKCNYTDRSGFLSSKAIKIQKGDVITIKRRVKVHYANPYFEGGIWFFQTNNPIITPATSLKRWSNKLGKALFHVSYYNYHYEKPGISQYVPTKHGFAIDGYDWRNKQNYGILSPIWNKWFVEEIIYDSGKNIAVYKVNGQIVKVIASLKASSILEFDVSTNVL